MKRNAVFSKWVVYLVALLLASIFIIPFIWSFLTSLKPTGALGKNGISFDELTVKNYIYILTNFPFPRWFINSLIVAVVVTVGNVFVNSLAGYALARMDFKGKKPLFYMTLGFMMVPMQVLLAPTYIILVKLGWIDSYVGLTVPFLFNLFNIFLMRQFFLSVPKTLEEAAEIDGLSPVGTFFQVVMPISKHAFTTQVILVFTNNWNSFLWPSLIGTSQHMYTLPVGLNSFYGQYFQYWNSMMAGVVLLTIPSLLIFAFFQQYFTTTGANTGLKE